MKSKIIPALIAQNQKELNSRFEKVKNLGKIIHIDVMDGKFVVNKSLWFDFKLPRSKGRKYWVHLLVSNPLKWLSKNLKKVDGVIVHIESRDDFGEVIRLIRNKRKKVGIGINPLTKVDRIEEYLSEVDMVLVMTVNPGKYGSKFLPSNLSKVRALKNLKPRLKVGVDGGINDKTITLVRKSRADEFVIGGYFQNAKDVFNAVERLN